MQKTFIRFLSLLLIYCFCPLTAGAQGPGIVTGQITDEKNAPVNQAIVRLVNRLTSQTYETRTDERGNFRFGEVRGGTYLIAASASGFELTRSDSFTVSNGETRAQNLVLHVAAVREQLVVEEGFVILHEGFSRQIAAEGRAFIWKEMNLPSDDPAAWKESVIHLQKNFICSPFDQVMNPRLQTAVGELMGENRGIIHHQFGWWPILFPGFPGPGGWHVDGSNFHHHLTSREQGLVTLYLFSDMEPGDGGTPMIRGSHQVVARLLAEAEPAGLSHEELTKMLPLADLTRVAQVTGEAGDVAMLHPFLIHGFGPNVGSRVRFACNPQYPLKEAMETDRPDGQHSPVEEAIRRALALS
jgi:uncharacterized protein (DUF433 family)